MIALQYVSAGKLEMRSAIAALWYRFALTLFLGQIIATVAGDVSSAAIAGNAYRIDYTVNADNALAYSIVIDQDLKDQADIRNWRQFSEDFNPETQTLDFEEAWVDLPGQRRIVLGNEDVRLGSVSDNEYSGIFSGRKRKTLIFPQLTVGGRIHLKVRLENKVPGFLGAFDYLWYRDTTIYGSIAFSLTYPKSTNLQWAAGNGIAITQRTLNQDRIRIEGVFPTGARGFKFEPNAPDDTDYLPFFSFSTLDSLEEYGRALYQSAEGKDKVTPEIRALTESIVQRKQGLDAAEAIHNWIIANIGYVQIWLNPDDGFVPHSAADVLRNGYGDCKDHVVLMQAMLAAAGIRSEPVIVNWGNRYKLFPVANPLQFNHVIIHLPDFGVFDNPTEHNAAFGVLDDTLMSKMAVIANRSGGVVRLPEANAGTDVYDRRATMTFTENGDLKGRAEISLNPGASVYERRNIQDAGDEAYAAARLDSTAEGGMIVSAESNSFDIVSSLKMSVSWESTRVVSFRGDREVFEVPQGVDFYTVSEHYRKYLHRTGVRKAPTFAIVGDTAWTTDVILPGGWTATDLPVNHNVVTPAGSYIARYEPLENGLRVTREIKLNKIVYEAAEYKDLEEVLLAAVDDSRAKVTAVHKP